MSFTFYFSPEEIEEADDKKKDLDNFFTLISPYNDKYSLKMSLIFLISGKIKNIICQDATQTTYNIGQGKYSKEFLDNFFGTIKRKITFDKNYMQQYLYIVDELKIEKMRDPLFSFFISDLYEYLNGAKDISIKEKTEYIYQNVDKIDAEKIKIIPLDFMDEIISNSQIKLDENRFVNFLINNYDIFGQRYFDKINFNALTNDIIIKLISKFQIEESSRSESIILSKLFDRIKKGMNKRIIINILFVTLSGGRSIDLNFIDDLNEDDINQNYLIHYRKSDHINFQNKIKSDNNYLDHFDIIMLGGGNSFGAHNVINSDVFEAMKKYHLKNGIVLFLHDALYKNDLITIKKLFPFIINEDSSKFEDIEKVCLSESCKNDEILRFPFDISKEEFKVAQTHQVPEFDPEYVVLCGEKNKRCYYSECLEEKFANYEIGHTQISSNFEKKLFYNIICHLYKNCHQF